jgi:hypothetical protein
VWLSRAHRCLGFGIQSPTDFQFVREVVNEHSPYYAYEELGMSDSWHRRRLGKLYFRLANRFQPYYIIDKVGASDYLKAGCRKAVVDRQARQVELAIVSTVADAQSLLTLCNDRSVIVVEGIWRQKSLWKQLVSDNRVRISFDLYYCGILMFDSKRTKQHYIINF